MTRRQLSNQLKESTSNQIDNALHSETVKTAVMHGDIAMGKAVEAVKNRAKELKESTSDKSNTSEPDEKE